MRKAVRVFKVFRESGLSGIYPDLRNRRAINVLDKRSCVLSRSVKKGSDYDSPLSLVFAVFAVVGKVYDSPAVLGFVALSLVLQST